MYNITQELQFGIKCDQDHLAALATEYYYSQVLFWTDYCNSLQK